MYMDFNETWSIACGGISAAHILCTLETAVLLYESIMKFTGNSSTKHDPYICKKPDFKV
jgi:hypothetical protein